MKVVASNIKADQVSRSQISSGDFFNSVRASPLIIRLILSLLLSLDMLISLVIICRSLTLIAAKTKIGPIQSNGSSYSKLLENYDYVRLE
jgi:hypothetical protein